MEDGALTRVNRAIAAVCRALDANPPAGAQWRELTEEDLAHHLCYGILSSGVTHEVADSVAFALRRRGVLRHGARGPWDTTLEKSIKSTLSRRVTDRQGAKTYRYRFPDSRARYVFESFVRIYGNGTTLRSVLQSSSNGREARERLIALAKGIGPKQASLFLRQVGFCDSLAVLDRHILRYLSLVAPRTIQSYSVARIEGYERLETIFRGVAQRFGYSAGHFDLAVWITLRVAARNAII